MNGACLDALSPADALLDPDWLARLDSYRSLWVGLSGGLDSVVLLHQLARLPALTGKITAVHIHHGLSPHANAWLLHCQSLCTSLHVPLIARHVVFDNRTNIEANARRARYDAFAALMTQGDGLLLAHHADDQAETLLLQLFRGAGIDGLSAMPTVKAFGSGELLRPFLMHSRKTLEAYASRHELTWVDDESNQDTHFSRNYLRHQIMPLLQEKWPGVVKNLNRTAQHCQQARQNLRALATLDSEQTERSDLLSLTPLLSLDKARCANALRMWLMNNQVRLPPTDTFNRLIMDVIFASADARPCVEWDGVVVRRYQNTLYLMKHPVASIKLDMQWSLFPKPLQWGAVSLRPSLVDAGLHVPKGSRLDVRCRKGGELFHWRGQTKTLKQLFQQWRIPPWHRNDVPLLYINDQLAAVLGFAVSDSHFREYAAYTYHIELHQEPSCPSH